jgi:hypothetical protein
MESIMETPTSGTCLIKGILFNFSTVGDAVIVGKAVTGVSRETVERAVASLEEQGFVVECDAVYTIWASKEKE